jgi:hypothetical protein
MTAGRTGRRWFLASATAATVVLVATLASRGGSGASSCRAALIPAYVPPHELLALLDRPDLPKLLVINPANGPGAAGERAYADVVGRARRAGVRVLGYVATSYGTRPAADVERDAARYRSWYGIDGVFLDEAAADETHLPYYRTLSDRARAAGDRLIVLNPGMVPARAYFDVADIVVTYEGSYAGYAAARAQTPKWLSDIAPKHIAHLIYGADSTQAVNAVHSADGAGYVYATSGVQPNPWRTIPPYHEHE